jgi:hypothetical protein
MALAMAWQGHKNVMEPTTHGGYVSSTAHQKACYNYNAMCRHETATIHDRITWNLRPIVELNPLVELVHRKILACIRV